MVTFKMFVVSFQLNPRRIILYNDSEERLKLENDGEVGMFSCVDNVSDVLVLCVELIRRDFTGSVSSSLSVRTIVPFQSSNSIN